MITAVADTNIYISALLFGGPCEAILGLARAGLLDLYDSPAIERELRRVLHEKFHWTDRQVRDAVPELRVCPRLMYAFERRIVAMIIEQGLSPVRMVQHVIDQPTGRCLQWSSHRCALRHPH